jgi:hypothetical protein
VSPRPPEPWERQPNETEQAFAAFRAALELGPTRSNAKVAQSAGKHKSLIDRWSRRWKWQQRFAAHQATTVRATDDAHLEAAGRRGKRQAELTNLALEAQAAVTEEFMRRVEADSKLLRGMELPNLLSHMERSNRALERLVRADRLVNGMTTEQAGSVDEDRDAARARAERLEGVDLEEYLLGRADERALVEAEQDARIKTPNERNTP